MSARRTPGTRGSSELAAPPARRRARPPRPGPSGECARPYAGRSPDERRRARHARLLGAGLAVFGKDGYPSATIPALCAHAGVTTRHFYEEFEGREALLRAVYDGVIAGAREAVLGALAAAGGDPRERTRASLDAFLHSYLDDARRGRIACVEVVGVSAALERHRRSVIHEFAAVIALESEESARRGLLPLRDFRLASIAMAGATNELVIEWLTAPAPPSIAELRDELLGLFVAIIAGARSAFEYVTNRTG